MWLPIGVLLIFAVILTTAAIMNRRGRRYHVSRSANEISADVREERRDVRVIDGTSALLIPPHESPDRTPPDY